MDEVDAAVIGVCIIASLWLALFSSFQKENTARNPPLPDVWVDCWASKRGLPTASDLDPKRLARSC